MTARAFTLGDLRVELEAPLARGAAGELLGGLATASDGAPALVVAAAPGEADRPEGAGWVPSFFHGSLRAWVRRGTVRLRDGVTTVTVAPDGRRIEVGGPPSADGTSELALLVALAVALRHHGLFHLHAAALETPGSARVLVAGAAGAGKTTLALALSAAGLSPLADDVVFLTRRGGARVVGFPRPFHVGERTAAAFPALAQRLGPATAGGKRPLDARAALGGRTRDAMALPDVVLLPEIARAARSTLEPISSLDAFGALLDCAALLVAEGMAAVPEHLSLLRAVADGARAARVRVGEDLLRDPAGVARALLAAC